MITKAILTARQFAAFARTTRDTLVHYENIGLLLPVSRNKYNYRQYSHTQLPIINLIRTCQELGMSLAEIKNVIAQRSPAEIDELLESKIKGIDYKVKNWQQARKLLYVLKQTIHAVHDVDEAAITVEYRPKMAITLGEQNDFSGDRDDYDALSRFYQSIMERYPDMGMNYPVWGMFSQERIKRRDWHWPDRFYFNNPDGLDEKAAGFYAIGYQRGGYGQSTDLYLRLLEYIDTNGLEICGSTYEEYPLNEICIDDDNNYLMCVMIQVDKIK